MHSPPRHWLLYLCVSTALLHAAFQSVRVLVSYRILALGGDAATIGMVTALYAIVPLLAAGRMGRAVDRGHATAILRGGIVVSTLGVGLIALSSGLLVLGLGKLADSLSWEPVHVNGHPAVAIRSNGELESVVALRIDDGLVTGLYAVRNPEKLARMDREHVLSR